MRLQPRAQFVGGDPKRLAQLGLAVPVLAFEEELVAEPLHDDVAAVVAKPTVGREDTLPTVGEVHPLDSRPVERLLDHDWRAGVHPLTSATSARKRRRSAGLT